MSFFLPYQKKWIEDGSRLKLMVKSRQIGMSWATAYGIVRRKAARGAKGDAWISSRDDLQARLFNEDCKAFAGVLHTVAKDCGLCVIDEERAISAYVLALANGCRLQSMSSNPDAQAGKRGDRILDEFALHPDPRKLWSIAYPGITWGGQMEVISTHRGSGNFFNKLISEVEEGGNPKGISLHKVTLVDALDQGFLTKLKAKLSPDDERQGMDEAAYYDFIRSGCADEESFLQEYMCRPSDDQGAFIGYELIDGASYLPGEEWEERLDPDGHYCLGVDIGRVHDLTVLWLVRVEGSRRYTVRVEVMADTPFIEQAGAIGAYAQMPWVRRVCIDATGIGRQLAEDTRRMYGAKVEGIQFTAGVKEEMAITLRRCLEDGNFKIPATKDITADFRSIRKETTSAGNVRYVGERTSAGHADRFWAAALALHAAKETWTCLPGRWSGRMTGRRMSEKRDERRSRLTDKMNSKQEKGEKRWYGR